jgi:hypothetical protein
LLRQAIFPQRRCAQRRIGTRDDDKDRGSGDGERPPSLVHPPQHDEAIREWRRRTARRWYVERRPTLNETLIAVAGDRVARLVTGNEG